MQCTAAHARRAVLWQLPPPCLSTSRCRRPHAPSPLAPPIPAGHLLRDSEGRGRPQASGAGGRPQVLRRRRRSADDRPTDRRAVRRFLGGCSSLHARLPACHQSLHAPPAICCQTISARVVSPGQTGRGHWRMHAAARPGRRSGAAAPYMACHCRLWRPQHASGDRRPLPGLSRLPPSPSEHRRRPDSASPNNVLVPSAPRLAARRTSMEA